MKGGRGAHPAGLRLREGGDGGSMGAVPLVEVWRGAFLESVHLGHAVVCGPEGEIREAWGDPGAVILPRSSCKMIQALPLAESGARVPPERLALACASHQGAAVHLHGVEGWLAELGLGDADLRCGPQPPRDPAERDALIRGGKRRARSTTTARASTRAFWSSPGGSAAARTTSSPTTPCSAPCARRSRRSPARPRPAGSWTAARRPTSPARSRASPPRWRASPPPRSGAGRGNARARAMAALREAMMARPELVAGEGRACTALMRAAEGVAVKTGAEGVFVAILPRERLGVALKIADGAGRASECAVAAILARLGVLDAALVETPVVNWRGLTTGVVRPSAGVWGPAGPQP